MKFYRLVTQYNLFIIGFFIFVYLYAIGLYAKNFEIKSNQAPKSGYFFSEPSTQNIQDDDFNNPGVLWVENGLSLWKKKNQYNNSSCETCHGDIKKMKGVALKYPMVTEENGKLVNLEQRINLCRKKMNSNLYEPESKEILSLSTLISHTSKGMTLNYKVTEKNKKWYDLGKNLYFKKIGLMGLSCNQCHDDRVGLNLRAERVSQGQINGFPSYLLRWSKVASVHKRIQYCNEQARAVPFSINSEEYNALQLYLSFRGNGLKIETPAVRK